MFDNYKLHIDMLSYFEIFFTNNYENIFCMMNKVFCKRNDALLRNLLKRDFHYLVNEQIL